jgi:hypothetical protein
MKKTMRKHGITVTLQDNGSYKVSGRLDGKGSEKWEMTCKDFNEAGSVAFEMADNNDQGCEINHKMCEVFGKSFFEDDFEDDFEDYYRPSSYNGDYGPSNPWNAPGMSVSDFI